MSEDTEALVKYTKLQHSHNLDDTHHFNLTTNKIHRLSLASQFSHFPSLTEPSYITATLKSTAIHIHTWAAVAPASMRPESAEILHLDEPSSTWINSSFTTTALSVLDYKMTSVALRKCCLQATRTFSAPL